MLPPSFSAFMVDAILYVSHSLGFLNMRKITFYSELLLGIAFLGSLNGEEETRSKFYTSGKLENRAGVLSIRILQLVMCSVKTACVGAWIVEFHL